MITDIVVIVVSRALMANLHWSTLQMARMALGVALGVAKPVMVLTPPYPCIYIELYIIVLYFFQVNIHLHVGLHGHLCEHIHICTYIFTHIHLHLCTYTHIS
jgi:hypothetical protein